MPASKPDFHQAQTLPAWIAASVAWLLLAALLLFVGLALPGEQASAAVLFQSETADPATGPITNTADITPTVTITPTDTPAPTDTPTQPPPTPEPTATWTPTPLPTATPQPTSTPPPPAPSTIRRHYVRGDSNVVIQWGMLVDSLALGISYLWLVAGILIGVGLPILFLVLWVRNRRRRSTQE